MKVFIKNKLVSLRGSSTVTDENNQNVFVVKGKLFSPTRKKRICDMEGNKLYKVRNKWFNFFSHKAFIYDSNGHKIACVKHPFFSAKKFLIQGYEDEIIIDGDFFSLQSTIMKNGEVMGTINREFTIVRDSFCLEGAEEDIPFLIALVIAIDNIQDKIRGR